MMRPQTEPPTRETGRYRISRRLLPMLLLCCQLAIAAPPALDLPLRCSPGQDCFIQNYFDQEHAVDDWRDYACGHLSYDGHSGTDFRLPGMAAMQAGVVVVAAASGVVAGRRDGEPDVPMLMRPGDADSGRHAAGNAVRIAHGDGWETQYSHLRQGSVVVHAGQQVHAGDPLGMVGLSGNTEFPHVDFTVRHHGQAVDPFAPSGARTCAAGDDSLWKPGVLRALRYIPSGILLAGWTDAAPDRDKARNGGYPPPGSNAAALVFWIEAFGVQAGDRQVFEIFNPQGKRIMTSESTIPGNKAAWFGYAGTARPHRGWLSGDYRAEYRLERRGAVAAMTSRHLKIP